MKQRIIRALPPPLYLNLKWWLYRARHREFYASTQRKRREVDAAGYTYKSFDETKSIFIHVPKCAGVSVCKALYGNLAGGHMTLAGYMNVFEPKALQRYFKFTFVRNPYDRLVSAFHFLQQGGMNDADRGWYERELGEYDDFGNFVRGWLTPDNIYKYWHFMPQHHFMWDPAEKIRVDYLGRFERLDTDFKYIADRLGCAATLPKSNSSARKSYKDYYDDETKEIVGAVYRQDLELIGYDFDGIVE